MVKYQTVHFQVIYIFIYLRGAESSEHEQRVKLQIDARAAVVQYVASVPGLCCCCNDTIGILNNNESKFVG